jgi:hypothetical protein
VGEVWLWQIAERMIQGDFSAMIGAKTKGFSGSQFCFGVKTLYNAAGQLAFGAEPVQYQWPMSA